MPPFAILSNDEEREMKARFHNPGTFFLVASPESFASLPEYSNAGPRALEEDSGGEVNLQRSLPTRQHRRQSMPVYPHHRDPNTVFLEHFELPTNRVPQQHMQSQALNPLPVPYTPYMQPHRTVATSQPYLAYETQLSRSAYHLPISPQYSATPHGGADFRFADYVPPMFSPHGYGEHRNSEISTTHPSQAVHLSSPLREDPIVTLPQRRTLTSANTRTESLLEGIIGIGSPDSEDADGEGEEE